MILTANQIQKCIDDKSIIIDPYDTSNLNPNSYNLSLGDTLTVYRPSDTYPDSFLEQRLEEEKPFPPAKLNIRLDNPIWTFKIPDNGVLLYPGKLYLGHTVEFTSSPNHAPIVDGRSSTARLGLSIHQTGGFGDIGFKGHWTLEIKVVEPVRIYSGFRICQIRFEVPMGNTDIKYSGKYHSETKEVASRLYQEFR